MRESKNVLQTQESRLCCETIITRTTIWSLYQERNRRIIEQEASNKVKLKQRIEELIKTSILEAVGNNERKVLSNWDTVNSQLKSCGSRKCQVEPSYLPEPRAKESSRFRPTTKSDSMCLSDEVCLILKFTTCKDISIVYFCISSYRLFL